MEHFVKMLHDRLETKKELQLQLYVIMQNAINEMHNNGIIASLTGEAANAVHDPDPEVRVREKNQSGKICWQTVYPYNNAGTFPGRAVILGKSKL